MAPVVKHFQYLVLGGGSGGIASARRAAEFGISVGLIEKGNIGGTCVSFAIDTVTLCIDGPFHAGKRWVCSQKNHVRERKLVRNAA